MRSGNIFDGQESTIEITVSGVASVNFWKKVSSEKYFDLLEFSIDGAIKGRWAGEDEDWSYVSFAINPFEPHRLKWKYSKDACYYMGDDCAYIDDITFETEFTTHTVTFDAGTYGYISSGQAVQTVASGYSAKAPAITPGLSWHFSGWDVDYSCVTSDLIVNALYSHLAYDGDDFESGTVDSLYQMSGDTGWIITDTAYSGTSAICSGVISDNQTSGFEISAPRAMGISFWLLVSCEEGYDWLNFYIDGVLQKSWSGVENVWSKETFLVLGIGSHTFTWTYVKDEIYFNGNDCVYIDDIVIKTAPIAYYGDSFETGEIAELYTAPDDVPWGITTTSYSGNYAVKCGATAVDTVSSIEVPVSGASAVSFRKLLDSVADHAWLRFYIDGALATEWSGQDSAWTLESYQLSPDVSHVLKWSYIKGSTQIGGTDSAFIDDILITVAADITGDNVVGIDDLFTMSDKWLSQDCAADNCAGADLNQDGFVGIEDFALLASSWLEQF